MSAAMPNAPLPSASLPRRGRLAAIDYGTVRLGVAITDPDQRLASPLENYTRRGAAADTKWLVALVAAERIVGFVIGLPIHTSGKESQKSIEARKFGKWVGEVTSLPVVLFDERYTTAQAEALLLDAELTKKRRKERLDKLAAQILLVAYLESPRTSELSKPLDDQRL
jgi:putative holliday junction resolvase